MTHAVHTVRRRSKGASVDSGDSAMLVKKHKVRVIAVVEGWRIEGNLHILSGARLTDAINSKAKDFLAMTDALIYEAKTGALLFETPYLALNRDSIALIFLAE
jgi:hypothetical protein